MQCVILAGGLGTRMRPHTEQVPKVLVPVAGKPFAFHQLDWLSRHGVDEVIFCIGYRGEQVMEAVGDGRPWGVRARYVEDGPQAAGTGGALRRALDSGLLADRFVVHYGDSYLPFDLRPFFAAFECRGLPAMMVVYRNSHRPGMNNVDFADGRVLRYDKRPDRPPADFIDYGATALTREVVAERIPSTGFADLADLTRRLSVEGLLAGYEATERFHEIGSPEGLAELERWMETARARSGVDARRLA